MMSMRRSRKYRIDKGTTHLNWMVGLLLLFMATTLSARPGYWPVPARAVCLNVSFHRELRYRLFDSVTLSANGRNFKCSGRIDSVTHCLVYTWPNLYKGSFKLRVTTVLGSVDTYTLNLNGDTTIAIPDKWTFMTTHNLHQSDFIHADSIWIYYNASGCFQDYSERILIHHMGAERYKLTYTFDTLAKVEVDGRLRQAFVQRSKHRTAVGPIGRQLFELVRRSQSALDSVAKHGYHCMSTSHKTLLVRVGSRLFQFSDSGICDWHLFALFRQQYFIAWDD